MPRVSLLIGDESGLGRIVEAGPLLLELLLCRGFRRVLVLTPDMCGSIEKVVTWRLLKQDINAEPAEPPPGVDAPNAIGVASNPIGQTRQYHPARRDADTRRKRKSTDCWMPIQRHGRARFRPPQGWLQGPMGD